MKETVRDLDILVASRTPAKVMNQFVGMDCVGRVLAHGATKSSVIGEEGIQIDLRVVPADCFGAALLYFTGSKEHNDRLRTLAKKRGLKINEYGLFNESTGRKIAGRTEEEVYEALGLSYIPPELREDRQEIEASLRGKLPNLVEMSDILGDLHMHSNWSDGVHSMEQIVERARQRKFGYVVLTDHSQSLKVAHGLSQQRIREQMAEIRKLIRS